MGTSTVKAVILAAVVVLGALIVRSAFPENVSEGIIPPPSGSSPTTTLSPSPSISPSPSPTPSPERNPRKKKTTVQVLNGTDIDFFAATWTDLIKKDGWKVIPPANGDTSQTTTIFYLPDFLIEAQALQQEFFPTAVLEEATSLEPQAVRVQILLGADAPSPSPAG